MYSIKYLKLLKEPRRGYLLNQKEENLTKNLNKNKYTESYRDVPNNSGCPKRTHKYFKIGNI